MYVLYYYETGNYKCVSNTENVEFVEIRVKEHLRQILLTKPNIFETEILILLLNFHIKNKLD